MSTRTYTIQRSQPDGELYALEYTDDELTGACGPLHYTDLHSITRMNIANLEYEPVAEMWQTLPVFGFPITFPEDAPANLCYSDVL